MANWTLLPADLFPALVGPPKKVFTTSFDPDRRNIYNPRHDRRAPRWRTIAALAGVCRRWRAIVLHRIVSVHLYVLVVNWDRKKLHQAAGYPTLHSYFETKQPIPKGLLFSKYMIELHRLHQEIHEAKLELENCHEFTFDGCHSTKCSCGHDLGGSWQVAELYNHRQDREKFWRESLYRYDDWKTLTR